MRWYNYYEKNVRGILTPPADKNEAIKNLTVLEPRLNINNENLEYIANIDSTEMTPKEWDLILERIVETYDKYDGFVITHGTDTMAYTAAALYVGLKGLGKPIVITGSQVAGCEIHNDARRNLINAIHVAQEDISGVYLVFDERIIEGKKATKVSESELDAYRTVNGEDAGRIKIEIELRNDLPQKDINKKVSIRSKKSSSFESDIWTYTITPGCDSSDLLFLLENNKIKGAIINGYGPGNIPGNFLPVFKLARKKKIPIIISTQCLLGKTELGAYEVSKEIQKLGIEGFELSQELLAVKLMWGLKNLEYDGIKRFIESDMSKVRTLYCPKCSTNDLEMEIEDYEGIDIDRCPRCNGIFLDAGELEKIKNRRVKDYSKFKTEEGLENFKKRLVLRQNLSEELEYKCPNCSYENMKKVTDNLMPSYPKIDVCPKCGGIWLDSGELRTIEILFESLQDDLLEETPEDIIQELSK